MIKVEVIVCCPHCGAESFRGIGINEEITKDSNFLFMNECCPFCDEPILIYWPKCRNLSKYVILPLDSEIISCRYSKEILEHIIEVIEDWENQAANSINASEMAGVGGYDDLESVFDDDFFLNNFDQEFFASATCAELAEIIILEAFGKPPVSRTDVEFFSLQLRVAIGKRHWTEERKIALQDL